MADLQTETSLTEKELTILYHEIAQTKTGLFLPYLLWFFGGNLGWHYFALNKPLLAFVRIALLVFFGATIFILSQHLDMNKSGAANFMPAYWIGLVILLCWLVEPFLIPAMVKTKNAKQKLKIIEDLIKARPDKV